MGFVFYTVGNYAKRFLFYFILILCNKSYDFALIPVLIRIYTWCLIFW